MPCLLLVVLVAAASPAVAAPDGGGPSQVSVERARVNRVLREIRSLDVQLEELIERYDSLPGTLAEISRRQAVVRRGLAFAEHNLAVEEHRLAGRLRSIYVSGEDDSTLGILLGSSSMADFFDRWETVSSVEQQDSEVIAEIERFKLAIAKRDVLLQRANARQRRLLAEIPAQRQQIEGRLQVRRRLVASIRAQIALEQAREQARQQWLRMLAEARLHGQAAELRALEAARRQEVVGASAVSPDGAVTVSPPSRYPEAVTIALRYLGVAYVWGGASPAGFDCSGLTMYVYGQLGVSLPHYAASQFALGVPVSRSDLQPGDLVFFHDLGHTGIYIGGGLFIHAPHTGDVVKISSLSEAWYAATYDGARRIL